MAGKSGCVDVILDDMVRLAESGFDISIADIGIGNIAFLGGIIAAACSRTAASSTAFGVRRSRPDHGRIRFPPFAQVHNMGQHFPFHVKRAQSLFADIFIFGYDDDADFGPFLIRNVVQKSLGWSSHESAPTSLRFLMSSSSQVRISTTPGIALAFVVSTDLM